MKKIILPYYVLLWDINKNTIEYYNIMPYLIDTYKKEKKSKHKIFSNGDLESFNGIKTFILNASKYRFWSRCEYEILISGLPNRHNEVKIDAYDQIEHNIDVITYHFINQL